MPPTAYPDLVTAVCGRHPSCARAVAVAVAVAFRVIRLGAGANAPSHLSFEVVNHNGNWD